MNPDTSGMVCLTCDTNIAPKKHCGNPCWHPLGKYILFQAEDDSATDAWQHDIATPGRGRYNNVWVLDSAGTTFINLTNIPYQALPHYGVLHPQFSKDGTKICWAEMIADNGPKGEWRIKVADFIENSGNPYISNIQTFHPLGGINFYETHGFSQSGNKILFSATLDNRTFHTFEIYTYDTGTSVLTNLTNRPDVWDEHAHYNKTEDKIIWMSSYGHPMDTTDFSILHTEWWIMDADGTNKQQISHFNTIGYPEYIPNDVAAADLAFSPDGSKFFGYVVTETIGGGTGINVIADLSAILSVESCINDNSIKIYPNPVIDRLSINSSLFKIKEISLYDITGRLVLNKDGLNNNAVTLATAGLIKGFYVMKINCNDKIITEKIIKE